MSQRSWRRLQPGRPSRKPPGRLSIHDNEKPRYPPIGELRLARLEGRCVAPGPTWGYLGNPEHTNERILATCAIKFGFVSKKIIITIIYKYGWGARIRT